MLKKLGITAMAAFMALATLSITEAAPSNGELNTLCHRGNYCYSQGCEDNGNTNGDCYNDGYCGKSRGCW